MFKKKATFVFLLASKMLAMGLLWYFFLHGTQPKLWKWARLLQITIISFHEGEGFFFFFSSFKSIKGGSIVEHDIYN